VSTHQGPLGRCPAQEIQQFRSVAGSSEKLLDIVDP
jgi:hypothetical protein